MTKNNKGGGACNCKSYNGQVGGVEETILDAPKWSGRDTICVDACIAETIKHLWSYNITTQGSCCGHNGHFGIDRPSIVLGENERDYTRIRNLIAEKDPRPYLLQQWQLNTINTPTKSSTKLGADNGE